ncbi:hypothetical protein THRCLA_21458 [Thraustotheca clavata]|uniref:Uncharacterized protein n=1 Tax=Thraustotheca clavata TaxID=74557 RepID=A0A1V9ZW75_9STRA|nr:hypothetical protein THRCLA_21458 [Thraustotheca clavata]
MERGIWSVRIMEMSSSVSLYSRQWHWNEEARVEGLRSLVHSFSQFAREIDAGKIHRVHFGSTISSSFMRSTSSMGSQRHATPLRQSLLQSLSSNYSSTPLSSSPQSPASPLYHSVSPGTSPTLQSPLNMFANNKQLVRMVSKDNGLFQVVLFHAWEKENDEMNELAMTILEKFNAMYETTQEWENAKLVLQNLTEKDDNEAIESLFQSFDDVLIEMIEIETAQV